MERHYLPMVQQHGAPRFESLRRLHSQSLPYDSDQVRNITGGLIRSPEERKAFGTDPAAYLSRRGLAVESGAVAVPSARLATTELCTAIDACITISFALAVVAVGWLVVAAGSYGAWSFAACWNLAWGCDWIRNEQDPMKHAMVTQFV